MGSPGELTSGSTVLGEDRTGGGAAEVSQPVGSAGSRRRVRAETPPSDDVRELGQIEVVPIRKIKPYPGNPRKIGDKSVKQTAQSLREFGWQQPIVVDPDYVIIVGHTRRLAALSLGLTKAPIVKATDLTPEQVKAYRIADNRTHDYSAWDYPQLLTEMDGLAAFASVLDLADWRAIIEQYESAQDEAELALAADARAFLSGEHALTVVFASEEERDKAGPAILEIPGVLNVRNAR